MLEGFLKKTKKGISVKWREREGNIDKKKFIYRGGLDHQWGKGGTPTIYTPTKRLISKKSTIQ